MNQKNHSADNIPKLRFPEFRDAGEWEQGKLGDKTIKVGSGITPEGGDKNYKIQGRPFVRSQNIGWGRLILENVAFIDETTHSTFSATEIEPNDVLLNITGASIGRCAVADLRIKGGNVNQHVCIIRTKNKLSPFFLNQYLLSESGQNQIDSFQAGGNRQGLNFAQIRSFMVPLPPKFDEQQKIASCLSFIDELITAQSQKLNALKAHKKGLMQQLFPAEGETVPKLRFEEFRDAGEWKKLPIGEKVDLFSGYPFKSSEISEDATGIPLMRGINITEGFIRHSQDIDRFFLGNTKKLEKYRLRTNDLVIGMDGSKVGKNSALIAEEDSDSLLIQRVARLRSKNEGTIQFIFQLINSVKFHSYVGRINTSGGIPHISADQINEFETCFPNFKEQQKIADCLSSIDELITAQSQKLDALKVHKKGLMQGLFPNVENKTMTMQEYKQ